MLATSMAPKRRSRRWNSATASKRSARRKSGHSDVGEHELGVRRLPDEEVGRCGCRPTVRTSRSGSGRSGASRWRGDDVLVDRRQPHGRRPAPRPRSPPSPSPARPDRRGRARGSASSRGWPRSAPRCRRCALRAARGSRVLAPADDADPHPAGVQLVAPAQSSTRSTSASSDRTSSSGSPQRALGSDVDGQPAQTDLERALDHVDQRRLAHGVTVGARRPPTADVDRPLPSMTIRRARSIRRGSSPPGPARARPQAICSSATLPPDATGARRLDRGRESRRRSGSRPGPAPPRRSTRSPASTSTSRSTLSADLGDLVTHRPRRLRPRPRRRRVRRRRHGVRARRRRRRARRRARASCPSGSGNDFARQLDIPRDDVGAADRRCCAPGTSCDADLGRVAHRRRRDARGSPPSPTPASTPPPTSGPTASPGRAARRSTCWRPCARSPPTDRVASASPSTTPRSTPTRGSSPSATRAPTRAG